MSLTRDKEAALESEYEVYMATKRSPAVTSEAEQKYQLKHPSEKIVWSRAVEVFGSEDLAQQWMRTPLPILDQHTPEEYAPPFAHCFFGAPACVPICNTVRSG